MPLTLHTLGPHSFRRGEEVLRLRSRKHFALLAYLGMQPGRAFTRGDLADLLWPATDERRGRHSLSQALYALRRVAPSLQIQTTQTDVRLDAGMHGVDAVLFRAHVHNQDLKEAVRLYQGRFLERLELSDAPRYERWRDATASELGQLAVRAFARLLDAAADRGDWAVVEALSERLLAEDPYADMAYRARIRCLALLGRTGEAEHILEAYRARWRDELAVADPVGIGELHRLVRDSISLDESFDETSSLERHPLPLIGREDELATLREAWDQVRAGTSRGIIVIARAGVGKSRLCEQLLRIAAVQGGRILAGRCYEAESRTPYAGIADALASGLTPADLEQLAPMWRSLLCHVVPELGPPPIDFDLSMQLGREGLRRRIFESMARSITSLAARQPVVLFVDDIHWADDSTAAALHFLIRRLADRPVLFLSAGRPEEVASSRAASALLSRRDAPDRVATVKLDVLAPSGARRLATALLSNDERLGPVDEHGDTSRTASLLADHTGGHALFLLEFGRALRRGEIPAPDWDTRPNSPPSPTTLPATLDHFFHNMISRLSDDSRALLEYLAVLGTRAPVTLLSSLLGQSDTCFGRAVSELLWHGLIRESGPGLAFAHALTRDAVYGSISGVQRRRYHGRAADALAASVDADPGTLAIHYDLAGRQHAAHRYALQAAGHSGAVYAHAETEFFLALARANAPTADRATIVSKRLGEFHYQRRRFGDSLIAFHTVLEGIRSDNSRTALLARAYITDIEARLGSRSWASAIGQLRRLYAECDPAIAGRSAEAILECLGSLADTLGNTELTDNVASMLIKYGERYHERPQAAGLLLIGTLFKFFCGGCEYAIPLFQRYEDSTSLDHSRPLVVRATRYHGYALYLDGRLREAKDKLEEACALEADIGGSHPATLNALSVCHCESGRYRMAHLVLKRALTETDQDDDMRYILLANAALLHYERNAYPEAVDACHSLLRASDVAPKPWGQVAAHAFLGLVALEANRYAEARQWYIRARHVELDRGFSVLDLSYHDIFIARMHVADGEVEEAVSHLRAAAAETRHPYARMRVRHELARILLDGDVAESERIANEVRTAAAEAGARPIVEKADALLERVAARRAGARVGE